MLQHFTVGPEFGICIPSSVRIFLLETQHLYLGAEDKVVFRHLSPFSQWKLDVKMGIVASQVPDKDRYTED